MVSRKYIQECSGVEDEANVIYSSQYRHVQCDIETEQTAMKRGAFIMSEAVIPHRHWFVDKTIKKDATYERAIACQSHDEQVYNQRRHRFEQYLFEALFAGKIVRVNQGKLSIVIASYNQCKYLQNTILSLLQPTFRSFGERFSEYELMHLLLVLSHLKRREETQKRNSISLNSPHRLGNTCISCMKSSFH